MKNLPAEAVGIAEAAELVKANAKAKFDETVEAHFRLQVDVKQSDQNVRGTMKLPAGAPKSVRVAVFTDDADLQEKAKKAGAEVVGGKELIDAVASTKKLDADVAVTTPETMKDLAKVAKVLGPKGLMPNPKTGTIGKDPAEIVASLKGGKVSFKMDDSGNVHIAIAKASWDAEKIAENLKAAIDAVKAAKPQGSKGEYLASVTLTSTMGGPVKVRA